MVKRPRSLKVPQKAPRNMVQAGMRLIVKFIAALAVLGVLLAGGLWGYIAQAGGLKTYFETVLTSQDYGVRTTLDEVHLHVLDDGNLAVIAFEDVKVTIGAQTLSVPRASIVFDPALWAQGQLWQLELSQMALDLVQDGDGFSFGGDIAKLIQTLAEADSGSSTSMPAPLALLANRDLRLVDSVVRIARRDDDALITLEGLVLTASYDGASQAAITGQSSIKDADEALIYFDGTGNLASGLSQVQLRTNALPLAQFAPFLPEAARPIAGIGALDSDVTMLFDGVLLQTAQGRFSAKDGALPNGARLDKVTATLGYSRQDDYATLSDVTIGLPAGQMLSFDGAFAGLSQDMVGFTGELSLNNVPIDDLLSQWPETALPDVRSYMIGSFTGGAFQKIALDVKGQFARQTKALSLSKLSFQGDVNQVRVETGFGHIAQFVGTANGKLALEVMSGGALRGATASLSVKDGYLRTKGATKALRFDEVAGEAHYQPGGLELRDAVFNFRDDGVLKAGLVMGVSDARQLQNTVAELSSERLSLPALRQLIPSNLAKALTSYMDENLSGGVLSDAAMRFSTSFENGTHRLDEIKGTARLDGVDVTYLAGQAPLEAVSADLVIADNGLRMDIGEAISEAFLLANASVTIAPLLPKSDEAASSELAVTAELQAGLAQVTPLLEAPQIAIAQKLPVNLQFADGDARLRLKLSAGLEKDKAVRFAINRLDGVITRASANDFYQGYALSQADLVIGYDGAQFDASGTAKLDDVAGEFTLKRQGETLQITGQLPPQEALATRLSALSSQDILGAIGGRFSVNTPNNGKSLSAVIEADVSAASMHVPLLDWTKLQGQKGQASGTLHFESGQLRRIDKLVIDAGDLRATGHLQLNDNGAFSGAYLEGVSWAGNDIDTIFIEQKGDDSINVIAEGSRIDLRNLRSGDETQSGALGIALGFDITSERLMIDDDVALFGQMTGKLTAAGDGTATLQGALLHKGNALLEEGTVTAIFGPSGEYLSAVGLIGGAEARLEFSPAEAGGGILIISTKNAGRVLSGLGVTDAIRAGRMVLVNEFHAGGFDAYDTTINLEEFNVIEAPTAVRAFSVLGLAGLYSLVEGDGTRFTTGEAQIQTRGTRHKITKMVASGGAVGLSMVGDYNSETRQVDMSGNLVPVNQFSKIIGSVPLLGELLSGVDNAGIFATQFNVKGDIDDPQTSVNAASVLPGVIRDIFSADWLGRERERLFGADNQTVNQTDNRTAQ